MVLHGGSGETAGFRQRPRVVVRAARAAVEDAEQELQKRTAGKSTAAAGKHVDLINC